MFAGNRTACAALGPWKPVFWGIALLSAFPPSVYAVNHPWADKTITSPLPSARKVDIPTVYSMLAQQENSLLDVLCEYRVLHKERGGGKPLMITTGTWKAAFPDGYYFERIARTSEDFKKVDTELWTYNGTEARSWASSNNSGGFGKNAGHSWHLFSTPTFFRSPLPQEAPTLTVSDILNPEGVPDLGKEFFRPEILGWEKIRLAEEECETVVIDVVMKASWRVKIWLDPERDYLPRRTLHYAYRTGKSEPDPLVDVLVDRHETIRDSKGRRSFVPSRGRVSGGDYGRINEYETISISVNKGLAQADFIFEWPEGCLVVNEDNGDWGYMKEGRYVPGRLYEEAKEMVESIEPLKLTSPGLQPKAAPEPIQPALAEKPGLAQEAVVQQEREEARQVAAARTVPMPFWATGCCAILAAGFLLFLYGRSKTR